ncbi:MAG TPA: aromatic ring-hydroxylating dioxygenase subunit alpha [Fimbriimonadaceae bacterium]|nr:aromatic ring-hydroxylating dioxygenase subunit alpha [Fimbriimonadaceae bacterium]
MPFEVDPAIGRAHTLPSAFYTDPALYEASKDRLFARSWQWVGDTDSVKVPGQTFPFILLEGCLDEPLLFTRDSQDQVRCLSNVCTHRGMLVCEGAGNERFLRCRYHGRRFGLDGKFQSMPEFEGCEGFPSTNDDLVSIPFDTWHQMLFVSLNPARSLAEWIQPMLDRVGWLPLGEFVHDPTRGRDYLVKANWALYVDNYLEGFHIPFIHAGLNDAIAYEDYGVELYERCSLQLAIAKGAEDVFDLPRSSPDYGRNVSAYYYWVFPNLMFNFYPWGLSINVVRPLAPDLTKVTFIPYVWDASKIGRGAGAALDRVEREDEAVVELVQKGVRSRFYDRGRYSPTRETGTHHFHRLLVDAMGP